MMKVQKVDIGLAKEPTGNRAGASGSRPTGNKPMEKRSSSGWRVVAVLFVVLFFIFGAGYLTTGVFFPPLIKEFRWSRTRVSLLASILSAAQGLGGPVAGLLLDRVPARFVMAVGAALAGCAMILAGCAHSLGPLLIAYLMLGVGLSASTLIPGSLVVASWFVEGRGLAMGIAMAGTTVGAMTMTNVASYLVSDFGWRAGYLVLGVPMLAVIVPLILFGVPSAPRSKDVSGADAATGPSSTETSGLDMKDAIRSRSFRMLMLLQFCFGMVAGAVVFHLVVYLIGLGYPAATAALILSAMFGLNALGKLSMGLIADRLTPRVACTINYLITGLGLLFLTEARHPGAVAVFVLTFGPTFAASLVLIPMITVNSLGMRCYGSVTGWLSLASTLAVAIGPLVAGRSFDVFRSYTPALLLFAAVCVIASASAFSCLPLEVELARAQAYRLRAT